MLEDKGITVKKIQQAKEALIELQASEPAQLRFNTRREMKQSRQIFKANKKGKYGRRDRLMAKFGWINWND